MSGWEGTESTKLRMDACSKTRVQLLSGEKRRERNKKKKGERKNEQEEGKKREQIRVKNVESKRAIERRIVCGG